MVQGPVGITNNTEKMKDESWPTKAREAYYENGSHRRGVKAKKRTSPMLSRKPPLQVLPSFLGVLGLGPVSVPSVYPSETVTNPAHAGLGRIVLPAEQKRNR